MLRQVATIGSYRAQVRRSAAVPEEGFVRGALFAMQESHPLK